MNTENPDEKLAAESKGSLPALVRISLTRKQASKLLDSLWGHQDEGHPGCGWASQALQDLRNVVADAIQKFDANDQSQPPAAETDQEP